eukprot:2741462-Amphidinium_carterae.4
MHQVALVWHDAGEPPKYPMELLTPLDIDPELRARLDKLTGKGKRRCTDIAKLVPRGVAYVMVEYLGRKCCHVDGHPSVIPE